MDQWKNEKVALAVSVRDEVSPMLMGRIDPLVGLASKRPVRLFPRAPADRAGAPVTVPELGPWGLLQVHRP